jgi:hypothetical protein
MNGRVTKVAVEAQLDIDSHDAEILEYLCSFDMGTILNEKYHQKYNHQRRCFKIT